MTDALAPKTVLILCALKEEYDQLRLVSDGLATAKWIEETDSTGWIISKALFRTSSGEVLGVMATWATQMGREAAQAVANRVLGVQSVQGLAMCGICAGRRGQVSLGDVIIADQIWSADAGKQTVRDGAANFSPDSRIFSTTIEFVQRAQHLTPPINASWLIDRANIRISGESPAELFKIHIGPVATVSAVTEDVDLFTRLAKVVRKVIGVEMEGSGLAALAEHLHIPLIVVKGVQDFGDPTKNSDWRTFSARAAAEILILLLRQTYDLLPSDDQTSPVRQMAVKAPVLPPHMNLPSHGLPMDLIRELAELYPDITSVRSLWQRAGGAIREVELCDRPVDLWQRLWGNCMRGARVTPSQLIHAALYDHPNNVVLRTNYGIPARNTGDF